MAMHSMDIYFSTIVNGIQYERFTNKSQCYVLQLLINNIRELRANWSKIINKKNNVN